MARRVLVEERVEEDGAGPADAALAVDERDLAEPRRAFVLRAAGAQRVGACRPRSRPPGRPRSGRGGPSTTRAADVERLRRGDDAVGAQRIGRRCDLLGRQVRVRGRRRRPSACPGVSEANREVGRRPTVRSVPGPSKCSASKRRASIRWPASCSWPSRCSQAAAASGSSSRSTKTSCSQSCASAASSSSPGWTRRAHSGAAHGTTVQFVVLALITSKFSASDGSCVAARARRVDAVEQPGRHVRRDRDARAVALAEREQPAAVPRRHELERVRERRARRGRASRTGRTTRGRRTCAPRS